MTKQEFAIWAAALKTYYPRENILQNQQAMELWFRQLQDIPYRLAEAVLDKWVSCNKWSPSIADIREQAAAITQGDPVDWSEAWSDVMELVGEYGTYGVVEAIEKMDTVTAECVRRLGWRSICLTDKPEVARANFRKLYEQIIERKKKDAQMPLMLKEKISKMILEERKDDRKQIGEIGEILPEMRL